MNVIVKTISMICEIFFREESKQLKNEISFVREIEGSVTRREERKGLPIFGA